MECHCSKRPLENLKAAGITVWPNTVDECTLENLLRINSFWTDSSKEFDEFVTKEIFSLFSQKDGSKQKHLEAINYAITNVMCMATFYNYIYTGYIYGTKKDGMCCEPIGERWRREKGPKIERSDNEASNFAKWLLRAELRGMYENTNLDEKAFWNFMSGSYAAAVARSNGMAKLDMYFLCLKFGICGFEKMELADIAKLPVFDCTVEYLKDYMTLLKVQTEVCYSWGSCYRDMFEEISGKLNPKYS